MDVSCHTCGLQTTCYYLGYQDPVTPYLIHEQLATESQKSGLTTNTTKTNVIPYKHQQKINVTNNDIEYMNDCIYLGKIMALFLQMDKELESPMPSCIHKINISTIIWKGNILENYLKEIPRNIELKRFYGPSAEEVVRDVNLENKTCLITGASGSIGMQLARCLSLRDCNVLMACRNIYKASQNAKRICEKSDRLIYYDVNLASLASVKECASRIVKNEKKIDIVILNAATFGIPWTLTEDKLETTFQVNFLSQYYLLLLVTNLLAPDARIVFTSAESHKNINWPTENIFTPVLENLSLPKHKYTSIKSYNISKLCGVLLMHYLSNQWSSTGKSVFCAHPGSFIKTGLCRNWWFYEILYNLMLPFTKTAVQGASTIIYCATSPDLKGLTAAYFKDCKPHDESVLAKNYYLSYRIHDLILEILRERLDDFDKLMCAFNSSKSM